MKDPKMVLAGKRSWATKNGIPWEDVGLADYQVAQAERVRVTPKPAGAPKTVSQATVQRVAFEFTEYLKNEAAKLNVCAPYVAKKRDKAQSEVLLLSDLHFGKEIEIPNNKYNLEIARQRTKMIGRNFLDVLSYASRGVLVDEIRIILNGDIVEGESIFETQPHHIATDVVNQIKVASESLWEDLLMPIRATINKDIPIVLDCVRGNHGRVTKQSDERSNMDIAVYNSLALIIKHSRVRNMWISISPHEFATFEIKGHRGLAQHEGVPQVSTQGARAQVGGWGAIHNMDFACFAHWHTPYISPADQVRVFQNGCLSGIDDLSCRIARYTKPFQLTWGVSHKRLTTHIHFLDVEA